MSNLSFGSRVIVVDANRQAKVLLGPAKHPGRTGTVVRENAFGRGRRDGLWYVQLDATKRAIAREETFWGDMLDLIPDLDRIQTPALNCK